jgi:hypothetical protein
MSSVKDMLGADLVVGDKIAYSTLSYKSAHQRWGLVKEIRDYEVLVDAQSGGKNCWQRASDSIKLGGQQDGT